MQDCARILHARLAWNVHAICPFSCTILAQSCTYILQEMVQDFARDNARIITCKFGVFFLLILAHFFGKILQELMQDCARIVQEKGHIACTCQASLACKILAQSCMILQVRFCWAVPALSNPAFLSETCYLHQ